MSNRFKPPNEWFKQADYDFKTAEAMFETGRYIYTVFMCHLSMEKLLKGLYTKRLGENPPKTHDLSFLAEKIGLELPEAYQVFLDDLNDLGVPTRYPDELETILKQYKEDKTKEVLGKTEELFRWLRENY